MRSVRTSHAFSFQDMWKWNSARSSTSRKAGYAPGSKIIEKLIFNQLFEYLIDSNLLADWQNGLRPVHSTLWPPCLEAISSENVKKAIGLISKTTTLNVQHTFLYISLPSPHDYGMKIPNFTFYGGRKQATMNLSFSSTTWGWSPRNQLQRNSPTFDIFGELEWARQSLKKREFILKVTFSLPSPCRCWSSLLTPAGT